MLVLQGGGALGAYQAGAYEALCEAGHTPSWVAGISIGSVNAAIIAGNPPEKRAERLREFWDRVSSWLLGRPLANDDNSRRLFNETSAALAATRRRAGVLRAARAARRAHAARYAGSHQRLRHVAAPRHAARTCRFRSPEFRSGAGEPRRGAGQDRQHAIFRYGARPHHRPGACHGERRAAAGLSTHRNRR